MQRLREPIIIMRHRCDVCGGEARCVYTPEMDRWLCGYCVKAIMLMLKAFD